MKRALVAVALVVAACAPGEATVGALRIEVPDGWRITRSLDESLQLADGLADIDQDEPGAARAVFDVYLDSPHTVETYRRLLEDNNVRASESELELAGRKATVLEYEGEAFAGRQIAVVIASEQIHIVYRAARIRDDAAFHAGKAAFLRAVRSIRFDEPPAA
jgi:hypothetical protein